MSNRSHDTTTSNPPKGQTPHRPPLPDPGKNPDFPDPEPIGPESTGGGSGSTPPTTP
jgi:hypothetical protein